MTTEAGKRLYDLLDRVQPGANGDVLRMGSIRSAIAAIEAEAGKRLRSSVASAALFNVMQEAGIFGRKRQAIEDAARALATSVRDEAVAARNAEIAEAVRDLALSGRDEMGWHDACAAVLAIVEPSDG